MLTIPGKYGDALIACDEVESSAMSQIYALMNSPVSEGAHVRVMPDVHAGAGCVIGLSMRFDVGLSDLTDSGIKIAPNFVGVDIGCGVRSVKVQKPGIPLSEIDDFIRENIPAGKNTYAGTCPDLTGEILENTRQTFSRTMCSPNVDYALRSIGTLGGGNHFIEIDEDSDGYWWIVVHSGSRHFGLEIANYYQKIAKEKCKPLGVPNELAYVEGTDCLLYLRDMDVAQRYARMNRGMILYRLLNFLGLDDKIEDEVESVHNFIEIDLEKDRLFFRKGAVPAYEGQKLLIPLNMRDGTLLCVGKGNQEWNCTAPHGAGRIISRSAAKEELNVEDFASDMSGIYTSCIGQSTLDEAPRAYKPMKAIVDNLAPMVDIVDVLKPVYNFKAN